MNAKKTKVNTEAVESGTGLSIISEATVMDFKRKATKIAISDFSKLKQTGATNVATINVVTESATEGKSSGNDMKNTNSSKKPIVESERVANKGLLKDTKNHPKRRKHGKKKKKKEVQDETDMLRRKRNVASEENIEEKGM